MNDGSTRMEEHELMAELVAVYILTFSFFACYMMILDHRLSAKNSQYIGGNREVRETSTPTPTKINLLIILVFNLRK